MKNIQRSMAIELRLGATDGAYKHLYTNRGGVVDSATMDSRKDLSDTNFGIHEAHAMEVPGSWDSLVPAYFAQQMPVRYPGS